ncbi:SAM-dependent methyltransferase [Moraxella osloensis]|uniref:tRNA 5-carboxymethoxyuridine methyltransferase n=1 Tax=Faucicola osloensis TaxID=34062 RepID=A0A378QBN1_FAUOS|nr:methyltransferase domain-containing protein [Moraxella osloensis]AME02016.1 SAM-dependent methyltransferase [Moraxella osloensis]OBX56529.1 SAM-dependent methyltransferase [Moraxella osloensis]QPT42238.1 methyltransferase domain-containing protein [Moraxella osloensis]STY97876.1 putative S-adenosyl-L-methionine-dependent methyltransferase [Moraxella osloensis]
MMNQDRNFDDISAHFEKKIYGGLKGQIRLAVLRHDIFGWVKSWQQTHNRPLRVLDVGAGLAQISIELAKDGHDVTINDISANMLEIAKQNAGEAAQNITWHTCPYQQLDDKLTGKYDLILCHAVLEWLAEPKLIMDFFDRWLVDDRAEKGVLSLCFYNPASFVYRNLVMGNFNLLHNKDFKADNGSLTPNHPVAKDEVLAWINDHYYQILHTSGLRVFHDYSPLKRGGHTNPQAVIEMEVAYSGQDPYKWLGRYLHFLVSKAN